MIAGCAGWTNNVLKQRMQWRSGLLNDTAVEHTNGVSCRCQFVPNPILTQCNNALLLSHAFLSHVWYASTSSLA